MTSVGREQRFLGTGTRTAGERQNLTQRVAAAAAGLSEADGRLLQLCPGRRGRRVGVLPAIAFTRFLGLKPKQRDIDQRWETQELSEATLLQKQQEVTLLIVSWGFGLFRCCGGAFLGCFVAVALFGFAFLSTTQLDFIF